jgi:hypothetical protein
MSEKVIRLYVVNADGAQIPGHGLRQKGEYFELREDEAARYQVHPWFSLTAPKSDAPQKAAKSEVQN